MNEYGLSDNIDNEIDIKAIYLCIISLQWRIYKWGHTLLVTVTFSSKRSL